MGVTTFIESKINKSKKGLHIYWWRPAAGEKLNFGDELTADIITRIWGIKCHWTRVADADMVGAGSILEIVRDYCPPSHPITVWGSGYIDEGDNISPSSKVEYTLVRGPLTAARISGAQASGPRLGDPGLLASRVYSFSGLRKRYPLSVVPHMKDYEQVAESRLEELAHVISPHQNPEVVAKEISQSEYVLSSSLHGLIFADSFGVPNMRLVQNELEGSSYKFNDYYQSTKRSMHSITIQDAIALLKTDAMGAHIDSNYQSILNLSEMQDIIIDTFPFKSLAIEQPN